MITKINGSDVQHATDVHFILNGQAAESAEAVGFSVINYAPYQLRDAADEDVETRVTTLLSGVQPDDLLIVQWPMWQADARFENLYRENSVDPKGQSCCFTLGSYALADD